MYKIMHRLHFVNVVNWREVFYYIPHFAKTFVKFTVSQRPSELFQTNGKMVDFILSTAVNFDM